MNNASALIQSLNGTNNPAVRAAKLSFFISDGLKSGALNIYEAYLIQWEKIGFERAYTLPAWGGRVRIASCVELLNQRLTALALGDGAGAERTAELGAKALRLCAEKRPHYIMDKYEEYITLQNNSAPLLRALSEVRRDASRMELDKGPLHTELFPYGFFEPENVLLNVLFDR